MSDQYGNQPPTPPPGQPGQPPYQGQPGQPPYPPQPGGPYGPGGPPPKKKSKTGLIIALVVVGVLVVAGVIVAGVLVARSGSDSDSESEPSAAPSSSSGPSISGDGYSYGLPSEAWTDGTEEVLAQSPGGAIDTVAILGNSVDNAQANILVESGSAGGATDVEDLRADWETNLSGSDGAEPEPADGVELDGEEAISVTIDRVNPAGDDVAQTVYLVIHEDQQYSIAASGPPDDEATTEALELMVDSWTWSS